jgi:diguanylate cyclase (GGDEF)-like protein
LQPVDPVLASVLLAAGAVSGAVVFSLTVGRFRARRLARIADRLARVTGQQAGPIHYPDQTLTDSLRQLATRIAEVEALATTDPLTRTTNRQACIRVLGDEISRANRHERALALALIDIDHFKRVNDTHGHAVGDAVLQHVAGLLKTNVRATDTLGRYGGEEFILVMPETDVAGAVTSAENLRRIVARAPMTHDTASIAVTISVGVTGGTGTPSLDIDAMLREADSALYNAKAEGRDQVQPYRAFDDDVGVMRATIAAEARRDAQQLGRAAFAASNKRLLRAVAERPGWAGGASDLIAGLAGELARGMGLPDGDVERIRTASLLHDLGKLAIPDEILYKPAALTPLEWRAIIEHPKIGQVVLEQAGAIRDAAAIVLHHHEWFDGRGYPYGLAGNEIPLGSRIVAIADAYEAMISERPYKGAVSHRDAVAELRRQAGTQFDPALVAVFVDLFGRGIGDRFRAAAGSVSQEA